MLNFRIGRDVGWYAPAWMVRNSPPGSKRAHAMCWLAEKMGWHDA